jgi:hypothetical protein
MVPVSRRETPCGNRRADGPENARQTSRKTPPVEAVLDARASDHSETLVSDPSLPVKIDQTAKSA